MLVFKYIWSGKKNFFWLLMLQPDTKKMLNVDSQKRKSSCKQSFLKRKCCFSTRKLTVRAWQNSVEKIFSSLFAPKRKSNANSTTRLWVTHKRKKPKNKTHDSLFSLFQIKQNSPKNCLDKWWPNHRTKILVGSAWQNTYPKQKITS